MLETVKWILLFAAVYSGIWVAGAWTLITTKDHLIVSDRVAADVLRETRISRLVLSAGVLVAAKALGAF